MRVCTIALEQRRCPYNHLWAVGAPYAIHSHPQQGTTTVVGRHSLDRVLPFWPGYVEFEPAAESQFFQSLIELTQKRGRDDYGHWSDMAREFPESCGHAMIFLREYFEGDRRELPGQFHHVRCISESAGQRCRHENGHDHRHQSAVRSNAGGLLLTYTW